MNLNYIGGQWECDVDPRTLNTGDIVRITRYQEGKRNYTVEDGFDLDVDLVVFVVYGRGARSIGLGRDDKQPITFWAREFNTISLFIDSEPARKSMSIDRRVA